MRISWSSIVSVTLLAVLSACASSAPPPPGGAGGPMPSAPGQSSLPDPAEPPPVNTLRWTTASEVDNFGFDIYRGESEEGPFERVTSEPIPGAGTTDEPQSYVWVDETNDPSRDYWYYIESISIHSERERFSPIIRAPAKRPSPE